MAITAQMRTQVLELYTAYFNRAADTAGVNYWLGEMDTKNWTIDNVAQSFADQIEYTAIYAGKTNAEIVALVYTNVLGRTADTEGAAYWEGQLANGAVVVNQLIQAVVAAAKEDVDGLGDNDVVANKSAVSQYAYDQNLTEAQARTISLANVTKDPASIAAAKDAVNTVTIDGETFVLTASAADSFIGTEKSDSITGTNATYHDGDIIIDATSTDNDILTLNTTANINAKPTVSGIERIVVNAEKAGAFTFDAQNISSANSITVNRLDLMDGAINGAGTVTINNAKATNFVAGDKVTAFTVNMDATTNIATAATVDATNATGAVAVSNIGYAGTTISGIDGQNFNVAGTTAKATVNASGEVTGTNGVDVLTVNATDALELTLDKIGTGAASDELILEGDADITLSMTGATLTGEKITNNATGTVTVVATTANALDLTKVSAVTSVRLDAGMAADIVVGDSQLITTATNQTSFNVDNIDKETTGTFRFAVLDNETKDTAVTLGAVVIGATDVFETVHLDATADELTATTVNVNDADVILTGAKTITLGTVTDANSIVSSSTGTVDMTVNGNTANEMLVALGAGDDKLVVSSGSDVFTVQTGAGNDTLTITAAAADSVFTTNDGDDSVTVAADVGGVVSLNTGAGNDTVTYNATAQAHTIDLGTGNNTLKLSTTIVADTEFTLGTGNNKIMVTAAADTTDAKITGNVSEINLANTLKMTSDQLVEFGAFALTGTSGSVLTIDATAATVAQTIDASAITLGYGVTSTVAITASTKGDTITGTIGDDAITLSATSAADTIINTNIAGNGTDTIVSFETGKDVLKLSAADINALIGEDIFSAGDLIADVSEFVTGAGAQSATGVGAAFLFNETSKTLSFDADGTGAGVAIDIIVTTGVNLAAADIVFIA